MDSGTVTVIPNRVTIRADHAGHRLIDVSTFDELPTL
jgi:hypothetical protein